jgi:serine/threonine-protein kinase
MRRLRRWSAALIALALLTSCGAGHAAHKRPVAARRIQPTPARTAPLPARTSPPPALQALVTDEAQNQLLVVSLPAGRLIGRATLPADPENVATAGVGGVVVVVSSRSGKVTLLDRDTLRPVGSFGGLIAPHIPQIAPDGEYAYVTDDAAGTVTVIRLADRKVTTTLEVGPGAHHLSFSPDGRSAWVALGESASAIAVLDTSDRAHPRLIGRFDPPSPAHEVSFTPDGRRVWVTSATGSDVTVLSTRSRRVLFTVPAGPPPQHVVFASASAYLTSGYGSSIERVDTRSGRVLERVPAPYGSFELDASGAYVVASSLLRGTLAIYTPDLRLIRVVRVAPAARDVAISAP